MANMLDKIKKLHGAVSIERKDFSLADLFKTQDVAILSITGLATKYVNKYDKGGNAGYHTTIYLQDGQKTGGFSGALLEFANFFYNNAGLDIKADFNKITFEGYVNVKVTKVKLAEGRSTYNFEIVDGEITNISRIGKIEGEELLLLEN